MQSFSIEDRYEKVFMLRVMKEARERHALRLMAIELIDHKNNKTGHVGETATINSEMNLLNRLIDEIWTSILTGPPIPGVVDPTLGTQTKRSGMDGDRHPIQALLDDTAPPKADT